MGDSSSDSAVLAEIDRLIDKCLILADHEYNETELERFDECLDDFFGPGEVIEPTENEKAIFSL